MSAPLETLGWPGIRKLKARIQEFWCILLTLILKNGMLFTQLWCIKNRLPFTPRFSVYLSMPPWQFSILYPILQSFLKVDCLLQNQDTYGQCSDLAFIDGLSMDKYFDLFQYSISQSVDETSELDNIRCLQTSRFYFFITFDQSFNISPSLFPSLPYISPSF